MRRSNWVNQIRLRAKSDLSEIDDWDGALPSWDGDNSKFVVEYMLPKLNCRPEVVQVIRWAYGYDGSDRSYEAESDGSSIVSNIWLGGSLKEPFGVAHDMLFEFHSEGLTDPSGHTWTLFGANLWYFKAMKDFGLKTRAIIRFIGLTLGSWTIWTGILKKLFGKSLVNKCRYKTQSMRVS